MSSEIKISHFPMNPKEQARRFQHPLRKRIYSPEEMRAVYNMLSKPLIEAGNDLKYYKDMRDELVFSILEPWGAAGKSEKYIQDCLRCSLHGAVGFNSMDKMRRRNGIPIIFHFIGPTFRLNFMHAGADILLAEPHHDDIEEFKKNPKQVFDILYPYKKFENAKQFFKYILSSMKGDQMLSPDRLLAQELDECAVWHVKQVTNVYKPRMEKVPINKLEDLKNPDVLNYFQQRMMAEDLYYGTQSYYSFLGSGVMKIFDRLDNIQNLPDPTKDLNTNIYAIAKAIHTSESIKKVNWLTSYYILKGAQDGANGIEAAYPGAREIFSLYSGVGTNVPINIFDRLDYHLNDKSFSQDDYESKRLVLIDCPRHEMNSLHISNLPRAGSEVIVIHAVEKQDWGRVDANPIEVQFPRRIGRGDPLIFENWYGLDEGQVIAALAKKLEKVNLPFRVVPVESLLPGKMGMDFIILRLEFGENNESFVKYLRDQSQPRDAYFKIIMKLEMVLWEMADNHFEELLVPADQARRENEKKLGDPYREDTMYY